MKLNDLKNGDVVVLRNGSRYMLVNDVFVGCETEGYIYYNAYDDDMLIKRSQVCNYANDKSDIVEVYRDDVPHFGIARQNNALFCRYRDHIDWSNIKVDTPILVTDNLAAGRWVKRYFAKFEDGILYAWDDGRASWTTNRLTMWKFGKLAESEGEK